ncbi:hypothetical protein SK128_026336 [Halocaridina rubra]|uniref:Uncharacterized protein n=1 Tax=Halocaridina rubra TaxID=373956 RepID=A0AAN9AB00_HALRR
MKALLDSGADINAQDWKGRTPLHWAANEGSIDTVQMLLDHKANKTLKNKDGHLYSKLLLKHLYFAVRHNDADKAVRLVTAGADQFAEVEGTGVSSREEAIRRGFYDVLRQMAALVEKKPRQEEDKIIALEDIHTLFDDAIITEDGDFSTPEDGQEECEEQDADEVEERDQSEEDDYDEEDAYWKMSNAYEILTVEEAFGEEDYAWLKEFEEKPKVISAKELLEEEQAAFWETWQEKQKVISAKEYFKEKTAWWEDDDDEDEEDEGDDHKHNKDRNEDNDDDEDMSSNEYSREDECWWRDAKEDIDQPTSISSKEYFQKEKPWWENEHIEDETDNSPKEYFTHDIPWWKMEENKGHVISSKDLFKDDEKPWWEKEDKEEKVITTKEYFQEKEPWWQEDEEPKVISAKEYFKEETPWWEDDKPEVTSAKESFKEEVPWWQEDKPISAKEFFKEEELPWWYTEEMHPEKTDALKKSLAIARSFERSPTRSRICGEEEVLEYHHSSDDEVEESVHTEDYEDATDSLISDSSTMYSASDGDKLQANVLPKDISWWQDDKTQRYMQKQSIPKAEEFFREKHWLDDGSETSEPTETLDMDTSEISEVISATDIPRPEIQSHFSNIEGNKKSEGSDESAMDDEDDLEQKESAESEGEEVDDEMGEEECDSECEELQSEDEIEDIMDEELEGEVNSCFTNTTDITNMSETSTMLGSKKSEDASEGKTTYHKIEKEMTIPSIVLHAIGSENGNKYRTRKVTERRDGKSDEDSSLDIISRVVSNSYETLEKENTNIEVGFTNTDSPIEPNQFSISVHEIAGNLQKSDSQTSGYDSSLSLSESKAKDLSKDSGCEGLHVDECTEDTDISDTVNPSNTEVDVASENVKSPIQDKWENVSNPLNDNEILAKADEIVRESVLHYDSINCNTNATDTVHSIDSPTVSECGKKVVIQMKWDTNDDKDSKPLHTQFDDDETFKTRTINVEEQSHKTYEKESEPKAPNFTLYNCKEQLDRSQQDKVNEEPECQQPEIKTYTAGLKPNLEKQTVNRMDDCLARLDASLAWLDATLTKEIAERASCDNLRERYTGDKMLTYAGAVKKGISLPVPEKTPKGNGVIGSDSGKHEGNDTVHFMKINVRVPDEEATMDQKMYTTETESGYGKYRFAGGSCSKRNENIDIGTSPDILYCSEHTELSHNTNLFNKDNYKLETECFIQQETSANNGKDFQQNENAAATYGNIHITEVLRVDETKDKRLNRDRNSPEDIANSISQADTEEKIYNINLKEDIALDEMKKGCDIKSEEIRTNTLDSNTKVSEELLIEEDTNLPVSNPNITVKNDFEEMKKSDLHDVQTTLGNSKKGEEGSTEKQKDENDRNQNDTNEEISEEKSKMKSDEDFSRESSLERLSPHREKSTPSLHTDRSLWRCSTYDALSISDYDNIAYMIQKSSSTPSCWGRKPKSKECSTNTDTADQVRNVRSQKTSANVQNKEQESVLFASKNVKESGTFQENIPTTSVSSGTRCTHNNKVSSDYLSGTNEEASVEDDSSSNLPNVSVPETSSVLLSEEPEVLAAEACTNLRDSSCNQDPPVAPRRTKEHSLQSQKLKYEVTDHSAHKHPCNAPKQPTNTTLYDPDKKETCKVEAADKVRPDEPRVQQVSTNKSKEGKKDKEKRKELAVATGKIDSVRKSSSCSVS